MPNYLISVLVACSAGLWPTSNIATYRQESTDWEIDDSTSQEGSYIQVLRRFEGCYEQGG